MPASTVLLLHFDEPGGVLPVDAMGNLDDLGLDPLTTMPSSASSWTGRGRQFRQADSTALIAADLDGHDTLLQRDVTVQVLLALQLAGATGRQTIVTRGVNDGTADEYVSLGLELEERSAEPGIVDVRFTWRDSTGYEVWAPAARFQSPGDGKWFLLTATRRWESSSRVVVRYYVDQRLIGEYVTTHGDISGSTVAHTTVGGRKSGGAWDRFLNATLDDLQVMDFEMSLEEIREVWRRLAVHQPAGVEMMVGLIPPGAPWYDNPGNSVGKVVKVTGQMLGLAIAGIERLRALGLPGAAPLELAERYERLCALVPRPRDSLDVRRARVIGHLSQDEGFSLPAIRTALAPLLDQAPDDVVILEFTNTITDSFDAIAPERWLAAPTGTWSSVAGELALAVPNGTDARWALPIGAAVHLRMVLAGRDGLVSLQFKLSTYWASLPVNTLVGAWLTNQRTNNGIWIGVEDVAGARKLGYRIVTAGVVGALVVLEASEDRAYWIRFATVIGGAPNTYAIGWSITGPAAGFTFSAPIVLGFADMEWAGFGALGQDAALATDLVATFDDLQLRTPHGLRPFCWYAYRDPTLPGTPDLVGAQALINRIKPGHTYAAVITSKSVLTGDPATGIIGRGPLGAL